LISLSDQEVPEDEGGDAAKQVDDLFEGLALSNGSKDAGMLGRSGHVFDGERIDDFSTKHNLAY